MKLKYHYFYFCTGNKNKNNKNKNNDDDDDDTTTTTNNNIDDVMSFSSCPLYKRCRPTDVNSSEMWLEWLRGQGRLIRV